MSYNFCYISAGSNQGDSFGLINDAIKELGKAEDIKLVRVSSIIRTRAFGYLPQRDYLNCVIEIKTSLTAEDLLTRLKNIETLLGRRQYYLRWAPRYLDLDILFYDSVTIESPSLCVPHPGFLNRDFLIMLMYELVPSFIHPKIKKSMAELAGKL